MKYINGNKVKAEIDEIIDALKRDCDPNELGTTEECFASAEITALDLVKDIIDKMMKDERIPSIDKESQQQGWLDYGLTMSEIGSHRGAAIRRMNENKDKFNPLAIPDFHHVAAYYQSLGIDLICNCLQSYCKNNMFTQDEVKNIIEKED